MSTASDEWGPFTLMGYSELRRAGFAIPMFAQTPKPNVWFTAQTSISGDRSSNIAGFTEYHDSSSIIELAENDWITVSIGDPWIDVFLWGDEVIISHPLDLISNLGRLADAVREQAPLTFLDIVSVDRNRDRSEEFSNLLNFLRRRFGNTTARKIAAEQIVRSETILEMRRIAATDNWPQLVVEAIPKLRTRLDDGSVSIHFEQVGYLTGQWTNTESLDRLHEKLSEYLGLGQTMFVLGGSGKLGNHLDHDEIKEVVGETRSISIELVSFDMPIEHLNKAADELSWLPAIDQQARIPFGEIPRISCHSGDDWEHFDGASDVIVIIADAAEEVRLSDALDSISSKAKNAKLDPPLVLVAHSNLPSTREDNVEWTRTALTFASAPHDGVVDLRPAFSSMYPSEAKQDYENISRYILDVALVVAVDYRLREHIAFVKSQGQTPLIAMGLADGPTGYPSFDELVGVDRPDADFLMALSYEAFFIRYGLREGEANVGNGLLWMSPLEGFI